MYKLITLSPVGGLEERQYVYRIEDRMSIPIDINNTDYVAYLKWLDEGNTPIMETV